MLTINIISTTHAQTLNSIIVLIDSHHFYNKPLLIIQKILRHSRKFHHHILIRKNPNHSISPPPNKQPVNFPLSVFNLLNVYCIKCHIQILILSFYITYHNILTNTCNTRSRKLKELSKVHSTCSKISLKMVIQIGPWHVAGFII